MKIKILACEPLLKGNENLKHGEMDIELGEDIVRVVFCKDCANGRKVADTVICKLTDKLYSKCGFCSYGVRSDTK